MEIALSESKHANKQLTLQAEEFKSQASTYKNVRVNAYFIHISLYYMSLCLKDTPLSLSLSLHTHYRYLHVPSYINISSQSA